MVKIKSSTLSMLPDAVKNAIKLKEANLYRQNDDFAKANLSTRYVLELYNYSYFLSENGTVTMPVTMIKEIPYSKDEIVELED
jgi:hypothetical protein